MILKELVDVMRWTAKVKVIDVDTHETLFIGYAKDIHLNLPLVSEVVCVEAFTDFTHQVFIVITIKR